MDRVKLFEHFMDLDNFCLSFALHLFDICRTNVGKSQNHVNRPLQSNLLINADTVTGGRGMSVYIRFIFMLAIAVKPIRAFTSSTEK